jgi:acetoin utilization protein AcuB
MIVKNWMNKNLVTIDSDVTASEAMEIFNEHKLPFLPVVDDGRLRGILARRDLRQAAGFVTATQSVHELNFFNTRLKVKDLMVRKPVTLSVDDPIDTALARGSRFGRSFFPVLDGDKLVGTLSNRDMTSTFRQVLGIGQKLCGLTIEDEDLDKGAIADIVSEINAAGCYIHSLITLKDPDSGKKRLLMRLRTPDLDAISARLEAKGYCVLEKNKNGV